MSLLNLFSRGKRQAPKELAPQSGLPGFEYAAIADAVALSPGESLRWLEENRFCVRRKDGTEAVYRKAFRNGSAVYELETATRPTNDIRIDDVDTAECWATKYLFEPSDDVLNHAFSLEFTGATPAHGRFYEDNQGEWTEIPRFRGKDYCSRFELVLPFLDQVHWEAKNGPVPIYAEWYIVSLRNPQGGWLDGAATKLARAAIIALLRSRGWKIEFKS